MDVYNLSERIGLSAREFVNLLQAMGEEEKASSLRLVSKTALSAETFKKFRQQFPELLLPINNFFVLNPKGKDLLAKLLNQRANFKESDGARILQLFKDYADARPKPKREYDQFYSVPETQVARVKLLYEQNEISDASIIFLGDDDLTSVCLALLGDAKRIVVIDIDSAQIEIINKMARELNLKIETYHHDLKNPVPKDLMHKFDLVFTDPPYTPNGFQLFLQREIECAKGISSSIYICYGNSERAGERFLPVQKIINDLSLEVLFAYHTFNKYTGAESIGSSSNLYVLRPTQMTKSAKKPDLTKIYTYE